MQKQISQSDNIMAKQISRVFAWFEEDVFRRLFLNAGKLLSASTVAAFIGLLVTAVTARALGPENYGILALVLVYQATISRLVAFNAWQAIIKFGSDALQANNQVGLRQLIKYGFTLDISSAIIGTIIAMALSDYVIELLHWNSSARSLLMLYSILILFSFSGTPTGILRLFDRFDLLSYTAIISALVKFIGVVWCLITDQSIFGFVLVYLITGIIGELYQVAAAYWVLHKQRLDDFVFAPWKGIRDAFPTAVEYVWTTNLHATIRMLSREADGLIIASLVTPSALGLFKIAKQFSQVLPMLIDPLYHSIYPELSRLWAAGNVKDFRSLIKRSTLFVGSAAICGWLTFIVLGKQIILWTVGTVYQDAYWLIIWYMLASVIAIITFSFQPSMLAIGLPKKSFEVLTYATVIYLMMLIILVNWIGIIGTALSYTIFYIVWSLLMFARLQQQIYQTH